MKLYLHNHNYKYATEQMLLTLFPGERPEYPEADWKGEDNTLFSSLEFSGDSVTARARLIRGGGETAAAHTKPLNPNLSPLLRDRQLQHMIKQAFYSCAVAATGEAPAWGALTGVRPVKLPVRAIKNGATPEEARRELEEVYHVSPRRAELAMDCAEASLKIIDSLAPNEVSLYIGIPFCPSRCSYCSFISADLTRSLKLMEPYLHALVREILSIGRVLKEAGRSIKTLYIGGGTPTTLSVEALELLLSVSQDHLPLSTCQEITVEAGRPDTITREKLELLRRYKVNRISINPQTLSDTVLKAIGRGHTAQEIFDSYALAREIGFGCINMDLIAGLPGDTAEGFRDTLNRVIDLAPENITVHTLARKKGARLTAEDGAAPRRGQVPEMLDYSLDTLRGTGYIPYYLYRQKYMSGGMENVGWCRPGTENVYNICMMEELHSVLSAGAGGVTKLVDPTQGRIVRLSNPKYPHDYLDALEKVLSQKEEITAFFAG